VAEGPTATPMPAIPSAFGSTKLPRSIWSRLSNCCPAGFQAGDKARGGGGESAPIWRIRGKTPGSSPVPLFFWPVTCRRLASPLPKNHVPPFLADPIRLLFDESSYSYDVFLGPAGTPICRVLPSCKPVFRLVSCDKNARHGPCITPWMVPPEKIPNWHGRLRALPARKGGHTHSRH